MEISGKLHLLADAIDSNCLLSIFFLLLCNMNVERPTGDTNTNKSNMNDEKTRIFFSRLFIVFNSLLKFDEKFLSFGYRLLRFSQELFWADASFFYLLILQLMAQPIPRSFFALFNNPNPRL